MLESAVGRARPDIARCSELLDVSQALERFSKEDPVSICAWTLTSSQETDVSMNLVR